VALTAAQMRKLLADNVGNAFVKDRDTRFGAGGDASKKRRKHETMSAFKQRLHSDRMKTKK